MYNCPGCHQVVKARKASTGAIRLFSHYYAEQLCSYSQQLVFPRDDWDNWFRGSSYNDVNGRSIRVRRAARWLGISKIVFLTKSDASTHACSAAAGRGLGNPPRPVALHLCYSWLNGRAGPACAGLFTTDPAAMNSDIDPHPTPAPEAPWSETQRSQGFAAIGGIPVRDQRSDARIGVRSRLHSPSPTPRRRSRRRRGRPSRWAAYWLRP